MKTFTISEYSALRERLTVIKSIAENELQRSEQSYNAVKEAIGRLKDFILAYKFKDAYEEIQFFKEIKPKFLSELLFFKELFYIEANKPVGNREMLTDYYRQITERGRIFFERNQVLYTYYRSGRSDHDELFFLRDSHHPLLLHEHTPDMDTRFCTVNSFKLGKIQAYEQLNEYVEKEINRLHNDILPSIDGNLQQTALSWTDKKSGLIELLYGIYCIGSLNNAHTELKQIATLFEKAFNTDLGNPHFGINEINPSLSAIARRNETYSLKIVKSANDETQRSRKNLLVAF